MQVEAGPKGPPPPPPPAEVPTINEDEEEKESEENTSPHKAAADRLIEALDIACAEMNFCAADDAARDADAARRNARASSEVARRYLNRSYPKVHSPFGAASVSTPSPLYFTQQKPASLLKFAHSLVIPQLRVL